MILTDYTTYDEIRAALGVSAETDIQDETLALPLYANLLQADLEDVNLDLPTTYDTVKALSNPTSQQARFLQAANVFATFAVARQLATSLPLFALKQVSDSKATAQRFDNPHREVIARVDKEFGRAKTRLEQSMASIGSTAATTTPRVFMSVASPSYDPITNV